MRYWISSLVLISVLLSCESVENRLKQFESIKPGSILVFSHDGRYVPQKVVHIRENDYIHTYEYEYHFLHKCPDRDQILDKEFEETFFLIYEYEQIELMIKEERIVRIYTK